MSVEWTIVANCRTCGEKQVRKDGIGWAWEHATTLGHATTTQVVYTTPAPEAG